MDITLRVHWIMQIRRGTKMIQMYQKKNMANPPQPLQGNMYVKQYSKLIVKLQSLMYTLSGMLSHKFPFRANKYLKKLDVH